MKLLLFLLSASFCSAFTVTDLLNPENAADRQNDEEDHILPLLLITFIGGLLINSLIFLQGKYLIFINQSTSEIAYHSGV